MICILTVMLAIRDSHGSPILELMIVIFLGLFIGLNWTFMHALFLLLGTYYDERIIFQAMVIQKLVRVLITPFERVGFQHDVMHCF